MTPSRRPSAAARRVVLHGRAQMAAKAAVAAVLASLAAQLFGSGLESYQYYAPLGAVVTTYPTVADSVRSSLHAVVSIVIGAALGLTVHMTMQPSPLAMAIVVAVGVGLAGLPFLGEQRSYVPIVALLVLVIGGSDAGNYALAYAALTLLGGVVGILVNLALPALRLTQSQEAVRSLQDVLADQLDDLADGLRQSTPPGRQGWQRRMRSVDPVVDRMRDSVSEAAEAQRGNPRARLHGYQADRQQAIGRSLQRVAVLVEDLLEMLVESYREDLPRPPLDPDLAAIAATAVERLAELVRSYDTPLAVDDDRVRSGYAAMQRLTVAFAGRRGLDPEDVALLGAIVANLRRCLAAVAPGEVRDG